MPFINDKLAAEQQAQQDKPRQQGVRQSRFRFDVASVVGLLQSRLVGQPQVLQALEDLLYVVSADMGQPHKPLLVCMLVGSTGVGKTETVRLLAEAIYGDKNAFSRIDMNTLSQSHYAAALTGAPPGYVGSKEGHTLLDAERIAGSYSRPGIVLLDEIEKASDEVLQSLLNVMDNGQLQLTAGQKTIDFRNAMIFMTSNAGVKELHAYQQQKKSMWRRWLPHRQHTSEAIINRALEQRFDPEFINRLDRVIHYQSLHENLVPALLDIEVQRLNQQLKKKNAEITLDQSAKDYLLSFYDTRYGARDIARHFRRELEPPLARRLLLEPEATLFHVIASKGKITVRST